ncbi:MAG: hypothetical protein IPK26_20230 [Planctomycetes bacterium]|nr:hypothetical protein [Planctomycetota bacterium]
MDLFGHVVAFDRQRGRIVVQGTETLELIPSSTATWTRYGPGCAGAPLLDRVAGSRPVLGGPFTLQLTSLPAAPGLAVMLFGNDLVHWGSTTLPVELHLIGLPHCRLWVAPVTDWLRMVPHAGVSANVTVVVPLQPELAGMAIGVQALVLDPRAVW